MAENGMKKFKPLIPILILAMGIVSSYSLLQWQSVTHGKEIEETKVEVKEQRKENERQNGNIIELKKDVKYMREDLKEIRLEQGEQKVILYKILGKLDNK